MVSIKGAKAAMACCRAGFMFRDRPLLEIGLFAWPIPRHMLAPPDPLWQGSRAFRGFLADSYPAAEVCCRLAFQIWRSLP